ncbi:terminase small subunit-like protein [Caballeronia grimmiae]|uniref:terminase small subunit-like protein n=1 Tax=Caballeronia grimmiae TaxID=1071679 RepID=UPI0038B721EB
MSTPYRHAGRRFFPSVIVDQIITRVAGGEALAVICDDASMPSRAAVYQWLSEDPLLSKRYTDAVRTAVLARTKVSHE